MKLLSKLLVAASAALLSTAASANIVANGSFEDLQITSGGWTILYNNALPDWQSGSGGVELRNNNAGTAHDGAQFVELDANYNSTLTQTISTVAGQSYLFSFAYSPRAGVAAASNGIDAFWNGAQVASLTASGIGNNDNLWSVFEYLVTATGASTTISFSGTGISDSYGGSLDSVSVVAVPEPASLSMLGLGLLGLSAVRRRKS